MISDCEAFCEHLLRSVGGKLSSRSSIRFGSSYVWHFSEHGLMVRVIAIEKSKARIRVRFDDVHLVMDGLWDGKEHLVYSMNWSPRPTEVDMVAAWLRVSK